MHSITTVDTLHTTFFLDSIESSQGLLPFIEDYIKTPPVSLENAIIPLISVVPDIESMLQQVKAKYKDIESGWTADQSHAIKLYLSKQEPRENSLFYNLNKTLRSLDRQKLRPWLLYLRLIVAALSQSAPITTAIYLHVDKDLGAQYSTGTTATWWNFTLCKLERNPSEKKRIFNRTTRKTLFVINCTSGRKIHEHMLDASEGAALLPPGCRFSIVESTDDGNGCRQITLVETRPAFNFFDESAVPDYTVNGEFQPISTVSLSKKSLPATSTNRQLEERLNYLFNQSTIHLCNMNFTDADVDILIHELIGKRKCSELNFTNSQMTEKSFSAFALALRRNKVDYYTMDCFLVYSSL